MVVNFELSRTQEAGRTKIRTDIKPKLEKKLNDNLKLDFKHTSFKIKYRVIKRKDGRFELYPSMAVKGDNDARFNKKASDILDKIKTHLETELTKIGASDFDWHIHYPDGRKPTTRRRP